YDYPSPIIFVASTFPSAFLEEWLFRYCIWAHVVRLRRVEKYETYFLSNALFVVVHIPAYLIQYHWPLGQLWAVFAYGLYFWFVFLLTKNVVYTSLLHALVNTPILFLESRLNTMSILAGSVPIILLLFWCRKWLKVDN